MPWAALIPIAISAISAGYGIASSESAKKKAAKEKKELEAKLNARPQYQGSEATQNILRETQSRLNAVPASVQAAYDQARQQAANTAGAAQRYSGSGAEALSATGAAQNRFQSLLPGLAVAQDEYQQKSLGNYYSALGGVAEEDKDRYSDQLARYGEGVNYGLGRLAALNNDKALGKQMAMAGLMSAASGLASAAGGNTYGESRMRVPAADRPISTAALAPAGYADMPTQGAGSLQLYRNPYTEGMYKGGQPVGMMSPAQQQALQQYLMYQRAGYLV